MPTRLEEDPDEPYEPDEPAPSGGSSQATLSVSMPSREWEYSNKVLTVAETADGTTLIKVLTENVADGWELADVIDGGDRRVLLFRRPKRSQQAARRVGFAPPARR